MKHYGFLRYKVSPAIFDENIEKFKAISLEEQKMFFFEILDYYGLDVNYSEIDDAIYNVSEENKKMNRGFYRN